jgi:peptidoglycan hydrolase-like protein with peptidoglycan-binding domain
LQRLGYYTWAIDGKMGPLTRAAIARYQRDHLLPITSGIDPATLGSLGVIR